MAIGTSLGAYFEDAFHHQAGIDTPPEVVKPGDTGDDNVSPPVDTPTKEDKEAQVIPVADIKTSNPNITITDEDIDKGMSLGMGFAGGGFHATLEGLGLLGRLGGKVSTSADGLPATVHLQGEAHDAIQEGPDAFQQFMATRGRNQPSNIEHPVEPALPANPDSLRQTPFTDHMSDSEFYEYGIRQDPGHMTPEQEARWSRVDREFAANDQRWQPEDFNGTEADVAEHHTDLNDVLAQHVSRQQMRLQQVKSRFENNDDVYKQGNISLIKDPEFPDVGTLHHYNFLSDGGVPGELSVRLRDSGRDVHVSWIGTVGSPGPMDVGRTEMKNLFKLLANQYTTAEKITGFRVSGVRAATGKVGDAEMRIPGRRAKPVNQEYGDDPDLLTRGQ